MATKQDISGLPYQGDHDYYRYRDVHMDTTKGLTTGLPDVHMDTAKMDTSRNTATVKQSPFKGWEKELLDSAEVKRKSTVAQLCSSIVSSCCRSCC
jgi:hypothetical protein